MMMRVRQWIRSLWQRENSAGWQVFLLLPLRMLAIFYAFGIHMINLLYDRGCIKQQKLSCKAISIGNMTVGGTGKTPLVIMLANLLRHRGLKPAVLSRGYGGKSRQCTLVVSDGRNILASSGEAGDEPMLIGRLASGIPVIVGKDRASSGRYAVNNFGTDVVILDDGFQHRELFRDMDIVLLDSIAPFGNGFILPAGPLREPAGSLKRADLILLTRADSRERPLAERLRRLYPGKPVLASRHIPIELISGDRKNVFQLDYIKGKNVYAFAGIGDPNSFRDMITSLGGSLVFLIEYPDHYEYTAEDVDHISYNARQSLADIILTTEKDGIRLEGYKEFCSRLLLLRIEIEIIPDSKDLEDVLRDYL